MPQLALGLAYLKDRKSFLHQVSPAAKAVWLLCCVCLALVVFNINLTGPILITVSLMALLLTGVRLKEFLNPQFILLPVWIPFILAAAFAAAFQTPILGEQVVNLAYLNVFGLNIPYSVTGWRFGYAMFMRGEIIIMPSLALVWTTHPRDLVYTVTRLLRVPYRIAWAAYLALIYMPLVQYEGTVVNYAHIIRGRKMARWNPFRGMDYMKHVLLPMIVRGLRRGATTAIAMDCRGFGAYPERTFRIVPTFSKYSRPFAIACVVAVAVFVVVFRQYISFQNIIGFTG